MSEVSKGWPHSWDDGVADGTLIDFSDAGTALGWNWPVAITAKLEERLADTLEGSTLRAADKHLAAMVSDILIEGHRALVELVGRPEATTQGFTFAIEASWDGGKLLMLALMIAQRDDGMHAWVMALPEEV